MSGLEIRFTALESPAAAAGLLVLFGALALLVYWPCVRQRGMVPGGLSLALLLVALRALALVVALLFFLRPVVRFEVVHPREERLAVLLDTSRSMAVPDSAGGETRLDSALRVLGGEAVAKLGRLFRLESYRFSASETLAPLSIPDAGDDRERREVVRADGPLTDFAAALGALDRGGLPLRAVVLLSDGRDHGALGAALASGAGALPQLPVVPVHAVGLGSGGIEGVDLAWERVECERRALAGSRVDVRCALRKRGLGAVTARVVVRLDGKAVLEQSCALESDLEEIALALLPERAGRLVYELAIEPQPREVTAENNRAHLVLEVSAEPLRVLFFEGRPRWQYKFARRALARDPSLEVTGLVVLAPGRVLEQGEAPRGLEGRLPEGREGWKAFDVVVLGDVSGEALRGPVAASLLEWVAGDGGGLIQAGAQDGLRGTPIAAVLPVEPGNGERLEGSLRLAPAAGGLEHPVTQGLLGFLAGRRGGDSLVLHDLIPSGGLRPGAEGLLQAWRALEGEDPERGAGEEETPGGAARGGRRGGEGDGRRRFPLLASRQYGAGRVLSWLTEADWRWAMAAPGGDGEGFFALLWGRMVRWAARRDGEGGGVVLSREEVRAGEAVEVWVAAAGEDPAPAPAVAASGPEGERFSLSGGLEGRWWRGRFVPPRAGVYRLEVERGPGAAGEGLAAPGVASGRRGEERPGAAILVVRPEVRELEVTEPDWELLRRVAEETGGRFFTLAEAAGLSRVVVGDVPGLVSEVELGLERSWPLFLVLVGALTLEWALRRKLFVV